jgi:hypothetical protein
MYSESDEQAPCRPYRTITLTECGTLQTSLMRAPDFCLHHQLRENPTFKQH